MTLFSRYIISLYLKYFFILFVSLECFFVLIDLVKYLDELPQSANLIVLLIFYDFVYASNFILPLSLVLAQIVLSISMLRNSQFTAFLALGYSKARIFLPIFIVSFLITLLFVLLNATPFAYAKERVDLIIERGYLGSYKNDLFIKYNENYIYFEKIFPLLKMAENVKVYEVFNKQVIKIIEAPKATFIEDKWKLEDAKITTLDSNLEVGKNPLKIEEQKTYETLEGFKPKILDNIYEKQGSVSIVDALEAIWLLKKQGVNTQKLRSSLYALIFFPFFAPLVMVCLARFTPNSNRYANIGGITLGMILGVLIVWGVFFSFSRLSMSGFLPPEVSIILPIGILGLVSLWLFLGLFKE